jgi:hypothetical protein
MYMVTMLSETTSLSQVELINLGHYLMCRDKTGRKPTSLFVHLAQTTKLAGNWQIWEIWEDCPRVLSCESWVRAWDVDVFEDVPIEGDGVAVEESDAVARSSRAL